MTNEVIMVIKEVFSFGIAIICLVLSKHRSKENETYATKYYGNSKQLVARLILTKLLQCISIVILIGIITNSFDAFIAFYILIPIMIALNLIFFRNTDWMMGAMTFIKGFYYLGLTIISMVQFLLKIQDVSELALGFTLSLAIFEGITALSDGYLKMQRSKRNPNDNR